MVQEMQLYKEQLHKKHVSFHQEIHPDVKTCYLHETRDWKTASFTSSCQNMTFSKGYKTEKNDCGELPKSPSEPQKAKLQLDQTARCSLMMHVSYVAGVAPKHCSFVFGALASLNSCYLISGH